MRKSYVNVFIDNIVIYGDIYGAGMSNFSCFLTFPKDAVNDISQETSSVIPLMNRMHFNINHMIKLQRRQKSNVFRINFNIIPEDNISIEIGHFSVYISYLNEFKTYQLEFNDSWVFQKLKIEAPIRIFVNSIKPQEFYGFKEFKLRDINETKEGIGFGSFGDVYSFVKDGKKFAAKFFNRNILNSTLKDPFIREILPFLELQKHPCILKMVGYFYEINLRNQSMGIVLKYMPNGSIKDQFENLEPTDCSKIVYGISSALSYMNSQGFIHRDIKPDNILLDKYFECRVSDFSLLKSIGNIDSELTMQVGGVRYSAPEVREGNRYDYSSDVYSLGMIIGSMFLKRSSSYQEIIEKIEEPLTLACLNENPTFRPTFEEILFLIEKDLFSFPDTNRNDVANYIELIGVKEPHFENASLRNDFNYYLEKFIRNKNEPSFMLLHLGFMTYKYNEFSLSSEYFKLGMNFDEDICTLFYFVLIINLDGVAFDMELLYYLLKKIIDRAPRARSKYKRNKWVFGLLPFIDKLDEEYYELLLDLDIALSADDGLCKKILKDDEPVPGCFALLCPFCFCCKLFDYYFLEMYGVIMGAIYTNNYEIFEQLAGSNPHLYLLSHIISEFINNDDCQHVIIRSVMVLKLFYRYLQLFRLLITAAGFFQETYKFLSMSPQDMNDLLSAFANPDCFDFIDEIQEEYNFKFLSQKSYKEKFFDQGDCILYKANDSTSELEINFKIVKRAIKAIENTDFVKERKYPPNLYIMFQSYYRLEELISQGLSINKRDLIMLRAIILKIVNNLYKSKALLKKYYRNNKDPKICLCLAKSYESQNRLDKYYSLIKEAADLGYNKAQYKYGMYLNERDGTVINEYLLKAASNFDVKADKYLCKYYMEIGDNEKYINYLKMAANNGDAESQYEMARISDKEHNFEQMLYYIGVSAGQNYSKAILVSYMIRLLYNDDCLPSNEDEFRNLVYLADNKFPSALLKMSLFYKFGVFVKQDLEEYKRLYDIYLAVISSGTPYDHQILFK